MRHEASKDSCKKSLSQDSLTLEELSSRLTGLVKGFATEEAAREYSRAYGHPSSVGRRERHSLSASFTALGSPPSASWRSKRIQRGWRERASRRQIRRRPVRPRHSSSRHSLV